MPEATRVAAELQAELGVTPQLVKGRGGVFIIRRDGQVRFDKADTHRFPHPGEAGRLIS